MFVEVKDTETGEVVGHLLDLSRDGLKLIGKTEMKKGSFRSFAVGLPGPEGRCDTVLIDVRCIWVQHDLAASTYTAGFMFGPMLESSRRVIDALLDKKEKVEFATSNS